MNRLVIIVSLIIVLCYLQFQGFREEAILGLLPYSNEMVPYHNLQLSVHR